MEISRLHSRKYKSEIVKVKENKGKENSCLLNILYASFDSQVDGVTKSVPLLLISEVYITTTLHV